MVAAPALAAPAPAASALLSRSHVAEPVALPVGFRPEGVTSGPSDTYYAGSLADGRIWTGDLSRGTGRQLLAGVTGRALRGMQYDARTGLLWATGQDGSTGIVLAVDARTGTVKHQFTVPGAVFLNDLVVTRKAVWVTDSRVDRLTRLPLDRKGRPTGSQGYLPLGGVWPTPEGIRANGIRDLPDGSLILDNSTAGGLWRVDPKTAEVSSIPVTGGPGIVAGDGLERDGKTLYVVRGSGQQEVSVLELRRERGTWTAIWVKALTSPALDVPSTATLVKRTLWAVNARFGVTDPATASFSIVPLPTR
jgi:streptogramin lyase